MTPEEAIQQLEFDRAMILFDSTTGEEITPEILKALNKDNFFTYVADGVAIEALKEIQQYREIGTVEECREAVEKQKAQKPKDSLEINPVIDGNGAYVDADTTVYLLCPNCEELVGIEENCDNYCRECGQKIDKESEEE